MATATCSTCRFMAASREEYWDDDAMEMKPEPWSTCVRIIHGNRDINRPLPSAEQPAMVVDGSGYAARLLVQPTFGCNLHEPPATPPTGDPAATPGETGGGK